MADTAPVLIWMSGADKGRTFFNKGWLTFTGGNLDQEAGSGWISGLHPDDADRVVGLYTRSFEARRRFTAEYRLRRFDRKYGWVLDTGVPRFSADGTFLGFIGTAIDMTEHKRSQNELREQRAELAQVARISILGVLSASLAQELNQSFTAIAANAEAARQFLAADPSDMNEINAILGDILKANSRAGGVIHRMQSLVKREELQFTAVDLRTVIDDVMALLRQDAILQNVVTGLDLDNNLPAVYGDRIQLQQVLLNILLNAFEAMKDCPPEERHVRLEAQQQDAELIRISVKDSGPGLTVNKPNELFEPFYTTKREGLGIGLSICRSIIEAHGGRLWAENNAGGGAALHFTVPVERKEEKGV